MLSYVRLDTVLNLCGTKDSFDTLAASLTMKLLLMNLCYLITMNCIFYNERLQLERFSWYLFNHASLPPTPQTLSGYTLFLTSFRKKPYFSTMNIAVHVGECKWAFFNNAVRKPESRRFVSFCNVDRIVFVLRFQSYHWSASHRVVAGIPETSSVRSPDKII